MKKTTKMIGLCRHAGVYTQGSTRAATLTETLLGLGLKLHEEVAEVVRAPRDVSEYADVLQALSDFANANGVSMADIEAARDEKFAAKGGFLPGTLWHAGVER